MPPLAVVLAALAPALAPDPGAPEPHVWRHNHRALQVDVGVAWGLAALGVVGLAAPLVGLAACPPRADCDAALRLVPGFAALAAAALLPAVVFTERLREHGRRRPRARLALAPGVVVLRY